MKYFLDPLLYLGSLYFYSSTSEWLLIGLSLNKQNATPSISSFQCSLILLLGEPLVNALTLLCCCSNMCHDLLLILVVFVFELVKQFVGSGF